MARYGTMDDECVLVIPCASFVVVFLHSGKQGSDCPNGAQLSKSWREGLRSLESRQWPRCT